MISAPWRDQVRGQRASDIGPWLLCLDLQREFVVAGRPLHAPGVEERVATCRAVLEDARTAGWPVIHAHRRAYSGLFSDGGDFARPVQGLEPLASEALFFRSQLSAFASPGLREMAPPTPGTTVFLVALSLDNACMATVLQGVDIGLRIRVVEDVIGASALGPYGPGVVAGVAKRLVAPFAQFDSAQAIRRETHIDLRGNPDLVFGGSST
jgi:nicotinamidase-related amidase